MFNWLITFSQSLMMDYCEDTDMNTTSDPTPKKKQITYNDDDNLDPNKPSKRLVDDILDISHVIWNVIIPSGVFDLEKQRDRASLCSMAEAFFPLKNLVVGLLLRTNVHLGHVSFPQNFLGYTGDISDKTGFLFFGTRNIESMRNCCCSRWNIDNEDLFKYSLSPKVRDRVYPPYYSGRENGKCTLNPRETSLIISAIIGGSRSIVSKLISSHNGKIIISRNEANEIIPSLCFRGWINEAKCLNFVDSTQYNKADNTPISRSLVACYLFGDKHFEHSIAKHFLITQDNSGGKSLERVIYFTMYMGNAPFMKWLEKHVGIKTVMDVVFNHWKTSSLFRDYLCFIRTQTREQNKKGRCICGSTAILLNIITTVINDEKGNEYDIQHQKTKESIQRISHISCLIEWCSEDASLLSSIIDLLDTTDLSEALCDCGYVAFQTVLMNSTRDLLEKITERFQITSGLFRSINGLKALVRTRSTDVILWGVLQYEVTFDDVCSVEVLNSMRKSLSEYKEDSIELIKTELEVFKALEVFKVLVQKYGMTKKNITGEPRLVADCIAYFDDLIQNVYGEEEGRAYFSPWFS